ncbi:MAG: Asp-tRNA(Asn)/Glu-tRNA(Gln) amidotransferase subunit GatC, partial [Candidatus Bipolaricaulota bacterium]
DPEERRDLLADLERPLSYFQFLDELDTEGVPPFAPPASPAEAWREDEVAPSLSQEEALGRASEAREGYFAVPRLFEDSHEESW